MKHKLTVLAMTLALVVLAGSSGVLAQGPEPRAAQGALGTTFTYQGQLKQNGSLVTASCSSNFKLFDAASGGIQQGPTLSPALSVMNGLFTTQLDFGNQFTGDARWVELTVDCGGGAVTLTRQALAATPYALGLLPGARIVGAPGFGVSTLEVDANGLSSALIGQNIGGGPGVLGFSGSGYGVKGSSTLGTGVFGETAGPDNGVYGYANNSTGSGVWGNNAGSGAGVSGNSSSGTGALGNSSSGNGVDGGTSSGYAGVSGHTSGNNNGVYGYANNGTGSGVYGRNDGSSVGVAGSSASGNGVDGSTSSGDAGVYGHTYGLNNGVHGYANNPNGSGVYGRNDGSGVGVAGSSAGGYGVEGSSTSITKGFAFRANGHASQSQDEGGWVKAMVYVDPGQAPGSEIVSCFNSQVSGNNVATAPCGFTYTPVSTGHYNIEFNFVIVHRYASVLAVDGGVCFVPTLFTYTTTAWTVYINHCTNAAPVDSKFYFIVY